MTKNRKTFTGTLIAGGLYQATPDFSANHVVIENTGSNDISVKFNENDGTAFTVHAGCVRIEQFPVKSLTVSSTNGSSYEIDVYEDADRGY